MTITYLALLTFVSSLINIIQNNTPAKASAPNFATLNPAINRHILQQQAKYAFYMIERFFRSIAFLLIILLLFKPLDKSGLIVIVISCPAVKIKRAVKL